MLDAVDDDWEKWMAEQSEEDLQDDPNGLGYFDTLDERWYE